MAHWPDAPSPLSMPHVIGMLESIEKGEIRGEKANRWLGWAQCAVVASGAGTLDEMKVINRSAMERGHVPTHQVDTPTKPNQRCTPAPSKQG